MYKRGITSASPKLKSRNIIDKFDEALNGRVGERVGPNLVMRTKAIEIETKIESEKWGNLATQNSQQTQ